VWNCRDHETPTYRDSPAKKTHSRSEDLAKPFRGGLAFKAHRLLYHSTLGLRVIKKKKKILREKPAGCRIRGQTLALEAGFEGV